ncbi:hypothetical protein ABK040_015377 [Willaertia magna]
MSQQHNQNNNFKMNDNNNMNDKKHNCQIIAVQVNSFPTLKENVNQLEIIISNILNDLENQQQLKKKKIFVFPELFLSGYSFGKNIILQNALPEYLENYNNTLQNVNSTSSIDSFVKNDIKNREKSYHCNGWVYDKLFTICKEKSIAICLGYAELVYNENYNNNNTENKYFLYNSSMIISPEGKLLLNYRKVHLYGIYENKIFNTFCKHNNQINNQNNNNNINPYQVIELFGFKISTIICFDIEMVEPCRILALNNCQIVLIPTANCEDLVNELITKVRAIENHMFIVYVNKKGEEVLNNNNQKEKEKKEDDDCLKGCVFNGLSIICAPNGSVLGQCSGIRDKRNNTTAIVTNSGMNNNENSDNNNSSGTTTIIAKCSVNDANVMMNEYVIGEIEFNESQLEYINRNNYLKNRKVHTFSSILQEYQ